MYILLSITSIILSLLGAFRAFKKKNLIIFVWIIVMYYAITSLIAILSVNNFNVSSETKTTYLWSVLLVVLGFFVSDCIFDKETKVMPHLSVLDYDYRLWKTLEIVYWISLVFTFLALRNLDYVDYNTNSKGGGWAQCFFQLSAGVNFIFLYRKEYLKLALSLIIVLIMIEAIQVRSFLFFPLMPVVFYFLYSRMSVCDGFVAFARKSVPMVIVLLVSSIIVGIMRFGEFSLPETELTDIALYSLDNWNLGRQYFISTGHYFYRLFGFFINILSHIGINISNPLALFPSVPRINAMLMANVSSVDFLENALHMPATIFFDMYVSWGYFCGVYAILVYYFLLKLFRFVQRDTFSLAFLSPILGWHIYMLLRGAVDTCSSGISYAFWMSMLVLYVRKLRIKQSSR